ncbi:hypothetical protein QLG07_16540 [Erwinia sp. V90_4]|uniref:hypothetical protein n=1 Tax=Erwinia sp. V90_4 TaxID=3044239 RepID=UPI00249D975C|nr:hypothetical protein [Erwinia sp. V90_4]MDI3441072.1 hypothetical protein [Erwinia sp. V90_4]
MGFDLAQLNDMKTWLAPLVTLTIGISGFIITTRARKKRFSNERISTLKDIQSLPASISDEKNIKEAVSNEMRLAVLHDLTGIKKKKEAETFLQIVSSTNLETEQLTLIKKSLLAISLAKDEKKEVINENEDANPTDQTAVNHRNTDIIVNTELLKYSSYLKCTLIISLLVAIVFMLYTLIENLKGIDYLSAFLSSILGIVATILLAYIDTCWVWPWQVDKVNELAKIINDSIYNKISKELEKIDSYIT